RSNIYTLSLHDALPILNQYGIVTNEQDVFRTPADIQKGLSYVYALFPGESEINFDSYFTDELGVGFANAGQGINDGSYTFTLLADRKSTRLNSSHVKIS